MSALAVGKASPGLVAFGGTAAAATELRSPASGSPCVHWRLRIVERLTSRTELVHEVSSEEPFEVWQRAGGLPPTRVRIRPGEARIQAAPVLHREGSSGTAAVARQLGLHGVVRVEEVVIRLGEQVLVEGVLDEVASAGPFRGGDALPELVEAQVRVPTRSVGPSLLPWAFTTAVAVMGGLGAAAYIAHRVTAPGSRVHAGQHHPSMGPSRFHREFP